MFETLFTRPDIVERCRAARLPDERLGYLEHCAQGGASRCTLRGIARHQVNLVRLLDLHEGERVNVARVEAAADELPDGHQSGQPASPKVCQQFIGHAERWLRFAGLLDEPARVRHAHASREVAAFKAWMRDERGLGPSQQRTRKSHSILMERSSPAGSFLFLNRSALIVGERAFRNKENGHDSGAMAGISVRDPARSENDGFQNSWFAIQGRTLNSTARNTSEFAGKECAERLVASIRCKNSYGTFGTFVAMNPSIHLSANA